MSMKYLFILHIISDADGNPPAGLHPERVYATVAFLWGSQADDHFDALGHNLPYLYCLVHGDCDGFAEVEGEVELETIPMPRARQRVSSYHPEVLGRRPYADPTNTSVTAEEFGGRLYLRVVTPLFSAEGRRLRARWQVSHYDLRGRMILSAIVTLARRMGEGEVDDGLDHIVEMEEPNQENEEEEAMRSEE